jgi:hypothetical protein
MKNERNTPKSPEQENNQEHSMVCNDQLFYQELRIAAEEAERDHMKND